MNKQLSSTNKSYKLEIESRTSELIRVFDFLSSVCKENNFRNDLVFDLNLIFEEYLLNLLHYGYRGKETENILIEIEVDSETVITRITDTAESFDIREAKEYDASLPLEKRRIGGIGIQLMKAVVNKIEYESSLGKNIITFYRSY